MSKQIIISKRSVSVLLAVLAAVVLYVIVGASPAYALGGWPETPDDTWATNGTVFDTVLSEDGKTLYVGGKFTVARENAPGEDGAKVAVRNLAAFDVATGEVIRTWRPQVTGDAPVVRSVEVKDGKVYIGGKFTAVNGEPRTGLAAVDAVDGSVDPNFAPKIETNDPSIAPTVYTILTGDSRIYIGGFFNFVDGKWRAKLAAVDPAGAVDNGWRPRSARKVFDLEFAADKETIFALGRFRRITGSDGANEVRETVARLYTNTGNLHPWVLPAGIIENPQTAWEALVTPTRLYAAFGDKGPNYVAAFRLDNGDVGSRLWRFDTVGDVYSLALTPDGSRLFFGGHFGLVRLRQTVCGKPLQGLASLNPANGRVYCDWIPPLQPEFNNGNGPWDMTMIGGNQLWVGGGFTHVSGVNQTNLARFTYDPNLKLVNYAPKVDLDGLQRSGLDATYFDNMNFTGPQVSRTDPTVNFNFGNGSPDPGIGSDTFSARWTGQIEAPVSGQYTFTTRSDDGVRLLIEGETVIDNWTDHAPTNDSGTITLEAGKRYDINLDYYENGGGAVIQLYWQPPGQTQTIIPSDNLFYSGGTDYSTTFTGGPTSAVDRDKLDVFDADDLNVKFAKVILTNRPDGNAESLSADTSGTAIIANYDPQTGVLSLSGPAPKADYESVLRTVSYNNVSSSPSSEDRKVTFVVNDGYVDSVAATSTVRAQIMQAGQITPSRNAGADKEKPRIYGISPRLKTADKTPTVRAKITDKGSELSAGNIRLYVDGKRVKKFSYNKRTDRLTHTTKRLSKGQHSVRIVATDKGGNRAVKIWKFKVLR